MSESETPIDQNTTGGEPVPPNEEENDVEVTEVNENGDSDDGDDSNNEDDDDDDDDDEDSEEDDDDDEEDFMAQLPKSVRHRVEKLKELNGKRDEIMEDYLKERAALEKKFSDLCKPLYDERGDIIAGKKDGEISAAAAASKLNQKEEGGGKINNDDDSDDDDEGLVGIPEFWTCCIHNIEAISELVTERDNACLLYLENITCEDFEDGKGFELKFYFKEDNPYFSNKILTKRYEIPNLLLDDEPILKNVTGCEIKWNEPTSSNCLTFKEVTKKQRSKSGKRAGQIRTVKKKEKTDSFFHFFCPPKIPNINDMDEDEADAIEEAFDHDYDVAQSFRSHIIPKAVMWLTGEAMQDEFERMMEGNADELLSQLKTNTNLGSPFPPPQNGSEEPECKQS